MMKTLSIVLTASAIVIARAAAQQPTPTQQPAQPAPAAAQPAPTPAVAGALQPGPSIPRVTLEQALGLGRRFNPSQVQAQQNLRVASMGVTQAWGAYLPTVSGTGTASRSSNTRVNQAGIP
ncbi:MAG TPA: hypothetical protein VEQ10_07200, partial [Vicinamibacteria bacterium]|nr:hypothetical protein [Vicinamibacteria bacterium]